MVFGVLIVCVTALSLAGLRFARWVLEKEEEKERALEMGARCTALKRWAEPALPDRCELMAGHDGPHRTTYKHTNGTPVSPRQDVWWNNDG
jgi:hypothetical protein